LFKEFMVWCGKFITSITFLDLGLRLLGGPMGTLERGSTFTSRWIVVASGSR
jgi:hypothetical protein